MHHDLHLHPVDSCRETHWAGLLPDWRATASPIKGFQVLDSQQRGQTLFSLRSQLKRSDAVHWSSRRPITELMLLVQTGQTVLYVLPLYCEKIQQTKNFHSLSRGVVLYDHLRRRMELTLPLKVAPKFVIQRLQRVEGAVHRLLIERYCLKNCSGNPGLTATLRSGVSIDIAHQCLSSDLTRQLRQSLQKEGTGPWWGSLGNGWRLWG